MGRGDKNHSALNLFLNKKCQKYHEIQQIKPNEQPLKHTVSILATLLLIVAASNLAAQTNQWKLVWSDEFNYQGLPDPAKWGYEEGFVRNGEKQYYTRARLENARVEDGQLVIDCRKEHFAPKNQAQPNTRPPA